MRRRDESKYLETKDICFQFSKLIEILENMQKMIMKDILGNGSSKMKNPRIQRAANSLQWRQKFDNCDFYNYTLEDNRVICIKQISNGEMKGLGTGAVVWPAAHILSKYLELKYGVSLDGKVVCDIGSGTGCVGLVATCLGARVTLTDQLTVEELILSNIEWLRINLNFDGECVKFAEYNWGENSCLRNTLFDYIIISDCVLPKLYPIEPLILVSKSLVY